MIVVIITNRFGLRSIMTNRLWAKNMKIKNAEELEK